VRNDIAELLMLIPTVASRRQKILKFKREG